MDFNAISLIDPFKFYFDVITTFVYYTVGGFGNIVSLVIFQNKEFKTNPGIIYLNAACVMNLVTIIYM